MISFVGAGPGAADLLTLRAADRLANADIVIWDPKKRRTLSQASLHHAVDYTLFEGTEVLGAPRTVLLRGELLLDNEAYVGRPGMGQFLKREKYRPNLLGA